LASGILLLAQFLLFFFHFLLALQSVVNRTRFLVLALIFLFRPHRLAPIAHRSCRRGKSVSGRSWQGKKLGFFERYLNPPIIEEREGFTLPMTHPSKNTVFLQGILPGRVLVRVQGALLSQLTESQG
jgi:hypothetical protein